MSNELKVTLSGGTDKQREHVFDLLHRRLLSAMALPSWVGGRVSMEAESPSPQEELGKAGKQRAQRALASGVLRRAAQHIEDRAAARDQEGGERSMARCVAAFNAITGHQLSERDGWLLMVVLKASRACTTPTGIPDDYEDMAAYAALAGECVAPQPLPDSLEELMTDLEGVSYAAEGGKKA